MNTSASRLPIQGASSDETCPHPAAFIADASNFDDGSPDNYQLMMGCVLCSMWDNAPISWQTSGDNLNIRQNPLHAIDRVTVEKWRA